MGVVDESMGNKMSVEIVSHAFIGQTCSYVADCIVLLYSGGPRPPHTLGYCLD